MTLTEFFQDRDQIIVSGGDRAVIHGHFAGWFAILPDDDPVCKAVSIHIRVVAEVILGHDKRDLARWQHDIARLHDGVSVFIGCLVSHIVKSHQNVTFAVQVVQDLIKFIDGGHDLVVAILVGIAVEGLGRVRYQGVEEYMGDLADGSTHQGGLGGFISSNSGNHLRVGSEFLRSL